MKILKIIGLPLIGIFIVLTGLVYDISFAGIPYQDPTPAMQAHYNFHSSIAGLFYKVGGVFFLIGLVIMPIMWKKLNNK